MKPDTHTTSPEAAADYEQIRGRDEAIGADIDHVRTPLCQICQRGTKPYICGPCEREWPVVWTCAACGIDHRFDDDDRCECGRLREDRG